MCECLDRGDGTVHVDQCCYDDWLRGQRLLPWALGMLDVLECDCPGVVPSCMRCQLNDILRGGDHGSSRR